MSKLLLIPAVVLTLLASGCNNRSYSQKFADGCHAKGGVVQSGTWVGSEKCYTPDGKFIPIEVP